MDDKNNNNICKTIMSAGKERHGITVLMSTYNGEKYLREQLDSLMNQTDVDVSMLIRDDGSKDATIAIIEEYIKKYSNISLIKGDNCGVAWSFWKLLRGAPENEYYAFCDQDDIWDSDKLKVAIARLQEYENSRPGLYYSMTRLVESDGRREIIQKPTEYEMHIPTFPQLVMENTATGCTMVWNKELNDIAKTVDVEYLRMHDHLLFLICMYVGGNVYFDTIPHISYRQHEHNVIGGRKSIKKYVDSIKKYLGEDSALAEQAVQLLDINRGGQLVDSNIEFLEQIKEYKKAGLEQRFKIFRKVKQTGILKNMCIKGLIILKRF